MQWCAGHIGQGALLPELGDPCLDDVKVEGLQVAHLLQDPAVVCQHVGNHLLIVGEGSPGVALQVDHLLGGGGPLDVDCHLLEELEHPDIANKAAILILLNIFDVALIITIFLQNDNFLPLSMDSCYCSGSFLLQNVEAGWWQPPYYLSFCA